MTITLAQVSDTHLSGTHAWFIANWPVFLGEMAVLEPDFVVHSGDISFNGPDAPGDLAFARACLDDLACPWRAIGGNHDIGEAPGASRLSQPVNDARIAAWRDAVGPLFWSHDLDGAGAGLRVIGLDTALMGSGHPAEAEQRGFLSTALAGRGQRAALVVTHMPPFNDDPDDACITTHCIMPAERQWLLETCRDAGVAAIAAGHIHRYSVAEWGGMAIVTAPGTSFVNMPASAPAGWRRPRAGYLVWTFDGKTLSHRLVEPRLMMAVDTSSWTEITGTTTNLPPRAIDRLAAISEPLPAP